MKALHYYIYTLGCQMNYSDTERFKTIIEEVGYTPTSDWRSASLIIFNTCSVKQKAEDRVTGQGAQISELKKKNSKLKVVLTGCMAKRSWKSVSSNTGMQKSTTDRENELKKQMPWIDYVVETKDFGKLPKLLGMEKKREEPGSAHQISDGVNKKVKGEDTKDYLSFTPKYNSKVQAYVPISTGCDHFCTYCIVPFARGREVCREANDIITEVFNLIQSGYKDITLLGQTVNRWVNPDYDDEIKKGMIANTKIEVLNTRPLSKEVLENWRAFFIDHLGKGPLTPEILREVEKKNLEPPRDFLQLLQVLDEIPGKWWTTFLSSHPNYMTSELITFIGDSVSNSFILGGNRHVRPYMHFALQSGSDQILKRMNRRHTYMEFKRVVDMMKKSIPNLMLSTDIIVGFPKETEEDFLRTVVAMKECAFDIAYISEYSPRSGTASAFLKDDVDKETKERWKTYLNDEVLASSARENNSRLVGTKQLVLIEGMDKGGRLRGRTSGFKQVRVEGGSKEDIGEFVEVEIVGCTSWALQGKIIS